MVGGRRLGFLDQVWWKGRRSTKGRCLGLLTVLALRTEAARSLTDGVHAEFVQ